MKSLQEEIDDRIANTRTTPTYDEFVEFARHFYALAGRNFMEKAEKWWYEHLVGFLKEGLTEGVISEFKQFMSE